MSKKMKENPKYKEDYKEEKGNDKKEKAYKQPSGLSLLLVSVILVALAIFIFICYVQPNFAGAFGAWFKNISLGALGGAAYIIPVFLLLHAIMHKRNVMNRSHYYKWAFTIGIILMASMFIHTVVYGTNNSMSWDELVSTGKNATSGGGIGGGAAQLLNKVIGPAGVIIFTILALAILVIFFLDITPAKIFDRIKFYIIRSQEKRVQRNKSKEAARENAERRDNVRKEQSAGDKYNNKSDIDDELFLEENRNRSGVKQKRAEVDSTNYLVSEDKGRKIETLEVVPVESEPDDSTYTDLSKIFDQPENKTIEKSYANKPKVETSETNIKAVDTALKVSRKNNVREEPKEESRKEKVLSEIDSYQFPPVDFLVSEYNAESKSEAEEEIRAISAKLESTLAVYGVNVKVVSVSRGPAITRYEVALEEGTRVNKIATLADELAYALATQGIIIEGVVEGKSAIGIEVPNKRKAVVYLRDLIDDDEFRNAPSLVWCSIGMDVAGKKRYLDIAKMPHLLVAGATGMGKSVCINSFIVSILYKAKPEEVKLILIDPKKVEFSMYKEMPHLLVPVISDPKKAAGALHWATQEMDRRFEILESVKVRNLDEYHEAVLGDPNKEYLPRIVIIIDELADLMQTAGKEVEGYICRIAQKARAAGMHLVIGTQRPSVDVVTGLIKANIPSRISCKVASNIDSRTILDRAGAEKLLGKGDMLYMPVGAMKAIRIQGSFVSNSEIDKVIEFIKDQRPAQTDDQIMAQINKNAEQSDNGSKGGSSANAGAASGTGSKEEDIMLEKAIEVAFEADKISTSLLQRKLSLGFGRAAKLIDIMEERGIVGPPEGQKPRQILISKEEYYQMQMNRDNSENPSEGDEE